MNNMNNHRQHEPALGISLADIYFIVFRHKRAIVLLTLLGLLAGAAFFLTQQPPFQSDAKLLIKYIPETRDHTGDEKNTQFKMATDVGNSVILAEAEILTGFDLFTQAATNLGPEKILAKLGGGNDIIRAAWALKQNLKVMPGKDNAVIALTFTHPDPEMVQPILREIIHVYKEQSTRIHSAIGISDDLLQEQITTLGLQIGQIDEGIRIAKTNADIVDLAEAKRAYSEEVANITRELFRAELELAGHEAEFAAKVPVTTNPGVATPAAATAPAAETARYKTAVSRLSYYQKKEDEYLFKMGYPETSKLVIEVRENIAQVAKTKTELEEKYPSLADLVFAPVETATPAAPGGPAPSVNGSPQRVQMLRMEKTRIQAQAIKLGEAETRIAELTRKKKTLDDQFNFLSTTMDESRIKEAMGPGHLSGINGFESPTPPFKSLAKYYKVIGGLVCGGLFAGLLWAFLFELYLDRTVKRASEIESKLHIPFFLAIPEISRSDRKLLAAPGRQFDLPDSAKNGGDLMKAASLEVNSGHVNHALDSHYDALRDRLVLYFESINLTRKPKLVAVTSAGRGAGVSTIASGLAASLSETGDGRVLLVDMNQENGGAQQFFHGKANCKLDDALLRDKRDEALVQERLYVVSEGSASDKLSRVLPKRFAALVPQLKASDYDYIIFDMPPVSQTSVTTRLAGFMDTVMLVIESEKTDRDTVQQAHALLSHSKANNVTAVLNKTKQHVPGRLVHDLNARG